CALGGCGTSTSDQIKAKVAQFGQAVRAKDGKTLCDQVLAPTLLEHFALIGLPCTKAMQVFFRSVQDPTLAVGRVVVTGRTAQAITLSGARGQVGSLSAVDLVDTTNGWRVSDVGSPLIPGLVPKKK
ncbi:MAG TPA: hypothetical protein VG275_06800, partial [Solirubrobacteraceae bacterium]|nr:hypothetical protein [Solirubrobacteraceae bacterium]